jgi:hypothetical protein
MRLACWRARPRDRELSRRLGSARELRSREEVRFGATPKLARGTRALPGTCGAILDLVEVRGAFGLNRLNVARF